jgi:hypothetical protein
MTETLLEAVKAFIEAFFNYNFVKLRSKKADKFFKKRDHDFKTSMAVLKNDQTESKQFTLTIKHVKGVLKNSREAVNANSRSELPLS